jgi:hypothetical protein
MLCRSQTVLVRQFEIGGRIARVPPIGSVHAPPKPAPGIDAHQTAHATNRRLTGAIPGAFAGDLPRRRLRIHRGQANVVSAISNRQDGKAK